MIGEDELQAFIDDRLDVGRRAAVEAHLAANPALAQRIAAERRQRDALRAALQAKYDEPVPARLRIATLAAARRAPRARLWTNVAAAVAIFVVGATAGWFANGIAPPPVSTTAPPMTASVAQGATAAYKTFVVEVAHPVEVGVQQEQHLLQWLSKRPGRRLVAPDLPVFGYRLMGGRLLPAGCSARSQPLYARASGGRPTTYVPPAHGPETAVPLPKEGRPATFAWIDQGFGFAVTATATREELLPIAEAVYRGFGS
ncbi:MAG: anti-sigma factor [Reyranella sp.]|nr:anti-sigma factor [Reyranella sp.]